jgi:hypothetical protein
VTVDWSTRDEIRDLALALRRRHGALDWTVSVDDLIKLERIGNQTFSIFSLPPSLYKIAFQITKKIKAFFSTKERTILISTDLHSAKQAFAKGHELGHAHIPWHQEIFYACDEFDLNPQTRAQLEWEANTFAAEILIPSPLLAEMHSKFPTSMETVLILKELSGASIESSAITYVSQHPGKCVLLVMEEQGKGHSLKVIRKAVSQPASKSAMGSLLKQTFGPEHVIFTSSRSTNKVGSCEITIGDDPKKYKVTTLNNTYRVMALVADA